MNSNIVKKTLKLDGLACSTCEMKIENKLKKIEGIKEVEVSYVTSMLSITYDSKKNTLTDIIKSIEQLDYKVINDAKNKNKVLEKENNNQLFLIAILIIIAYFIIKHTVGFSFIPQVSENMSYPLLFVVGLLSSLHCVAMCGGINLSLCVAFQYEEQKNHKYLKYIPSFMYNVGRVISYTIIGGIVGAFGMVFQINDTISAVISLTAGIFIIIMGCNMLNIFPWLRKLNPRMPKLFAKKIYSNKRNKGPFVVGLLNGFMPCGPLQAIQLYALGTGSFIKGALSMFLFSLGTVPLLFLFGALGSLLSSKFTKKMVKVSALFVILLGLVMMNRGFALTGINTQMFSLNQDSQNDNQAVIVGDYQEITTTLENGSYPPITVKEGIPVKWIIKADAKNLNGCNNEIIIKEYNLKQKLVEGDNVITFTPMNTGQFGYSCWMGMIRSSIMVVGNED